MNHEPGGVKNAQIQTLMVPTALKLPLQNDPPTFLTHLGSPRIEKNGRNLVRTEDPVLDTGRRTKLLESSRQHHDLFKNIMN